jgi:hypothetical protein
VAPRIKSVGQRMKMNDVYSTHFATSRSELLKDSLLPGLNDMNSRYATTAVEPETFGGEYTVILDPDGFGSKIIVKK